ncbi:sensor domain-containing diguanylate cyclase [Kineobactrum salinum]|uniref:diguanylate cyclase n=1 Tax=Kineobactrum salinum TaxID=2708301 RepID=A0A6C0TZY9_9GAMM|nr:sensor domain-containing diguanylate cyclase [Kineobactrum salinum]QIB65326.1 diguanylate cyclase [Kineobactrum salinum]
MPKNHPDLHFRELHRLSLADYAGYPELYREYLASGLRLTGMTIGLVVRIQRETCTILAAQPDSAAVAVGETQPLGETWCAAVVAQQRPVAVADAGRDALLPGHAACSQHSPKAYLAAPIWVNNEIYGTLSFFACTPQKEGFSRNDRELIELMARGLSVFIERDQLEQQRLESLHRMQQSIDLFESAFRFAAIGMALVSPEGRWLRVNDAVCQILGYTADELLAIDFQTITHPDDLEADLAYLQEMLAGHRDVYRMEKRYHHRSGRLVWVLLSVSLVRDPAGTPLYFLSQLQDVTEQKRATEVLHKQQRELTASNARLQRLATVDELTEVYNRRAFFDKFNAELERSARAGLFLSVLIIDVDHFKQYNDSFGHPEGDQALRRVAAELERCGRVNDVCARYGGEEFAVVLPDTDEKACLRVAERMRAAVEQISDLRRPLTVSIGCATTVSRHGQQRVVTTEAMLSRADKSLYEAKEGGRNRVVQSPSLVQDPVEAKLTDAAAPT